MQHANKKLPGKELRHYKILDIYGLVHYISTVSLVHEHIPYQMPVSNLQGKLEEKRLNFMFLTEN